MRIEIGHGGQDNRNAVMLAHLATIPDEIEHGLRLLVMQKAWMIHNDAKERMGSNGTPSTPGGYPGVRSGRLKGSMGVRFYMGGLMADIFQGGDQAPYAKYLRDGTKKMAARPSLEPSLMRVGEDFANDIRAMIAGVTR